MTGEQRDPGAVLRDEAHRALALGIGERRAAVRTLHAKGLSDGQIAERLVLNARTVLRIRQELDLQATG